MIRLAAVFAFILASVNLKAQSNDNALIGKARGAAHECLTPYLDSHDINAYVDVTGICFANGDLRRVTFIAAPKCPPNMICAQYFITIATVDFDCDGNIIAVNCNPSQL